MPVRIEGTGGRLRGDGAFRTTCRNPARCSPAPGGAEPRIAGARYPPRVTAEWLLQRVRGLADVAIRRRAMAGVLAHADPAVAAAAAADLVERAARGGDDAELAAGLACLVHAVGDLDYPARQALYVAARARGADAVARLLLDASPATAEPATIEKQLRPERPLRQKGRPLTLGERKALARSGRRDLLALLLRDPHPDVVRILLDNPRLTERDAVMLAAMRPAVPESLAAVADHRRWSARHMVRRALVLNPHTPVHVALRLATTLGATDWREIAADNHLPAPLRTHVAELLRSTGRAGRAGPP